MSLPLTSISPQSLPVFGSLFAPIAADLAASEEILRRELRSRYPFVDELVKHSFRLGGKRLRPALLLLSAQACGHVERKHHLLAAVMEMIHTATLAHDDVLDQAAVRRHLETLNARWDNQASVLLGDFLFSHSFYLASTTGSTYACETIGRATNAVCEGELRQIHSRGNLELTEEEYFGIIDAKTAELCACCCRLGAHFSAASSEQEEALASYGRLVGLAFQVVDDVLDVLGDEERTGKSLGTDLAQQKLTLPLIRLLRASSPDDAREIRRLLREPAEQRRAAIEPWLQTHDAIESSRRKAAELAQAAATELDVLPDSPAKSALLRMAELVVQRDA